MVDERRVLLGVEHLEQGRGRVAAEVVAQLVDLVEHEHRVAAGAAAQPLDDLAGQGADIGAPVAADLGLVPDTAQGQAVERPSHGPRHRLAQGGLAGPGGTDKTQDGAA